MMTEPFLMVLTISFVIMIGAFSPGRRTAPTRISAILAMRARLYLLAMRVINLPDVISSNSLSLSMFRPKAMVWAPAPNKALIALLAKTPLPIITAVAGGTLTTPPIITPRPP